MKNYVIINGVNSLTITGLAISKLPSISKPPLRVMTEEINGRDGDLITELGYGAYDKELVIGLYGNYDINEVIGFFNQEGTIVFSNEDDKYYNFKIINQIDYEALIKFRTATISLHCQPFKYPLTETPEEITTEYVEDEGETITLNDTKVAPLEIDLKGNTSQTGTPTPSSPIPVNVVSGDNEIVVCGKNLFDKTTITENQRLDPSGGNNYDENCDLSDYIKIQPNTTYTRNITASVYECICFYTINKTFIRRDTTHATTTSPNNAYYVRISCYKTNLDTLQLEKGSSATSFEPYQGANYQVNLGSLELCKIGNYQDYIFKNGSKWYLHKAVGKVAITCNSTITHYNNLHWIGISKPTNSTFYNNFNREHLFMERAYYSGSNADVYSYQTGIGSMTMGVMCNGDDDATTLKNLLDKSLMYYPLQTPTEEEITNTTLINQLEALRGAMSYEGQTNISQVNNDLPFILSVKGIKEGSGEGIINNIGNIYAKPIIALEGTGNIGIYKNGTQYFEVDMSNDSKITIDTENMEAYHDGVLKNRQVIGDYNKFTIDEGNNNIEITGELTKATISNYTRWL